MGTATGRRSGTTFDLSPRAYVGQGREGKVYRSGDRCVKVFDRPLSPDEGWAVEALARVGAGVPGFSWPEELAFDPGTGRDVGFAMPFNPGETLEAALDRRGTAGWGEARKVEVALGVARAVAAAHAVRAPTLALGDVLKAGNAVVDGDRVTLVDASSVSLLGFRGRDGGVTDAVSRVTTPGYVPREVLDHPDAVPSHAADRFALAVVLFETLLGAPPTEPRPCPAAVGLDPDDAVRGGVFPRWVRHPDFRPPDYDPVDLPAEADGLFRSAFLAGPHDRPTAERWVQALEDWRDRMRAKPTFRWPWYRFPLPSRASLDRVVAAGLALAGVLTAARWVSAEVVPFWAQRHYANDPPPAVAPPPPPLPRVKVGPPLFDEVFR